MAIQRIETAGDAGVEHRVLRDRPAMQDLAEDWRALEARAGDPLCYFQSHDWCCRWMEAFGNARRRPEIHTLWQGGKLVAVWPLMLSGGALKRLEPLGWPHSQYANILADPAIDQQAGAQRLLAGLDAAGHDVALVESVPAGSCLAAALENTPPMPGRANSAAMLDLSVFGSSEDYAARLSKTQRRNRNRRRAALAREGDVSFAVLFAGDAGFEEAVATCLVLKREWLRETGRLGTGLAYPGFGRFLASLSGSREALSGACLFVLRAGDRLVAGELGFLHHGHYYAYLGAFDWALRDASPGKTQMDMAICWLIEHGISTYDLLGNPADYKDSWSNRTLRLETYALPANLAGRAYATLWTGKVRPGLKRLYEALPNQLRRLAQFGQSFGLFLMIA